MSTREIIAGATEQLSEECKFQLQQVSTITKCEKYNLLAYDRAKTDHKRILIFSSTYRIRTYPLARFSPVMACLKLLIIQQARTNKNINILGNKTPQLKDETLGKHTTPVLTLQWLYLSQINHWKTGKSNGTIALFPSSFNKNGI